MGLFNNDKRHYSNNEGDEETDPLRHSEAIEMSIPGRSSFHSEGDADADDDDDDSHNNFNNDTDIRSRDNQQRQQKQHHPLYRKLGRLAEEGWSSVANLVQQQHPVPRASTAFEIDDPQPETDDFKNDLKRKLYLLLEDPSSSRAAFWTNVIVSFLIVFSAMTTTIETIPSFRFTRSNRVWFQIESALVALFTLEYLLRMFAHSDSFRMLKKFFLSPLTFIDFISIVPFYIELIAQKDTTYEFRFTILRLFRLLRLFKSYKYSNAIVMTLEVMMMAFRRSGDALSALFFFTVTCVVLFSTLLYFAERGVWDDTLQTFVDAEGVPSSFDSIPAAFWFVLVTITTTGFGDMVPTTFVGKLITFPAMMFGVLLIALPSIIVGRNFTIVWETMRRRQFSSRLAAALESDHDENSKIRTNSYPLNPPAHPSSSSAAAAEPADRTLTASPTGFKILPDTTDNDDEMITQIQKLTAITLQNQAAINRILAVLENQGIPSNISSGSKQRTQQQQNEHNPYTTYNKGKSPLMTSTEENVNPFDDV